MGSEMGSLADSCFFCFFYRFTEAGVSNVPASINTLTEAVKGNRLRHSVINHDLSFEAVGLARLKNQKCPSCKSFM
jgi:hypothetical protein